MSFLHQFLVWYFWYYWPSQELLVAMLVIHHWPQSVILYNQVRVLLGCDNVHKAKNGKNKKKREKKGKKGGCSDAENRTPDVRTEVLSFYSVC